LLCCLWSPLFKLIKYKIVVFDEVYILFHFNIILNTKGVLYQRKKKYILLVGADASIHCRLEGPGFDPWWDKGFFSLLEPVQNGPGIYSTSSNGCRSFFLGKTTGTCRWPPVKSSAMVRTVELYFYTFSVPSLYVVRRSLVLLLGTKASRAGQPA
jgi:hypothetical protein